MTIDSAGFYLYMLVVETFTADKIRLRIYAIIGWGKTNQIKKKAIVFLLSFLIAAAAWEKNKRFDAFVLHVLHCTLVYVGA